MPGLMGRISTLVKAKITNLLNRSENPAETLDYAYERQLEDVQNVKQGIAGVVTAKKRLQMQESELWSRKPRRSMARHGRRCRLDGRISHAPRSSASSWLFTRPVRLTRHRRT